MTRARFAAGFALTLGLLAAQDTQVITLPAPPGAAAGQPSGHATTLAHTRGLLWKATSGATTVYLAGSLHFGSEDMYPLPQEMEDAFQASSVLVIEVDPNGVTPSKVLSLVTTAGVYPPGDTLWNHVSGRTRSLLPAFAAQQGLSAEMLSRLKPWAVNLMLAAHMMQEEGMRPDLGIDMHFMGEAGTAKRIEALETVDQQMRALVETPESENALSLEETVTDPERAKQMLGRMKAAWVAGDTAALEAVVFEDLRKTPESRKRLLDERNVSMTAAIARYLKGSEPCFVVVGSAHLLGKDGIVSRLTARGFSVKRVVPAN
jgi:hypothetical protein